MADLGEKRKKKDKKDKKDKKRKRTDEAAPDVNGAATEAPSPKRVKVEPPKSSGKDHSCTPDDATFKSFTAEHNITVDGNKCHFRPSVQFSDLGFPDDVMAPTKKYKTPTPIQAMCWPVIVSNRDIVGIAETGSGKTLAFSLPLMNSMKAMSSSKHPLMLVLAPTRELAKQISDVCTEVGEASGLKTLVVYGGVDKAPQRAALRQGVHILVATPGRLIDLCEEGVADLSFVKYFVLDEADRMLDMGFEKDIRAIAAQLKGYQQTLMFSATWPQVIQRLAHDFLKDPVKVTIGSQSLAANHRVTQTVEVLEPEGKDKRLLQLLNEYHKSRTNRILVFVLYKKEATRVEGFLKSKGFSVAGIHSDKNQADRTRALESFKSGQTPLLVATDVAARGLDVPNVEYVINYTFPLTVEEYVHRIGRTGRAGKTGVSHTFFTKFDKAHSGGLINVLKEANQTVPANLMQFGTFTKPKEQKLEGPIVISTAAKSGHLVFDNSDEE